MIDPSLLSSRQTVNETFDLLRRHDEDFNFFIPKGFYDHVIKADVQTESPVLRYFRERAWYPTNEILADLLRDNTSHYSLFDVAPDMREKHESFRKYLTTAEQDEISNVFDQTMVDIIFEEWVFLQERSLIVSRTKRAFDRFIEGGALVVQASDRHFRNLISRTVGEPEEELRRLDYLRAFGKWLAASGPPVLLLAVAPVWGAVLTSFTGFALVVDP